MSAPAKARSGLSLFLICGSFVVAQPFSVADVLSAPFPSSLVATKDGNTLAWIFNEEGKRNIWVAEGSGFNARRLTDYMEDDGQEMGGLNFSPDGEKLVYVRGGATNRQEEHPNPTSGIEEVQQEVWCIEVASGKKWRLGEGSYPQISPKGDQVVLVDQGDIYIGQVSTDDSVKKLFSARGSNTNPVWSPSGNQLAFVSYRDDHSFIGVFDFASQKILWMVPSVDRDREPVWSPDGKRIAFFRFPGALAEPRKKRGMHLPFSIMVADVSAGTAVPVWTLPDSSGGFAQNYPIYPLMWGKGDNLVFYSEHAGWMHLYSVPAQGGKVKALTSGNYEVEAASLTPDWARVVFNSNNGDIDRRHMWEVRVTGEGLKQITKGEGLEWEPIMTSKGDLAFFCSTAQQAAAPAVLKKGERRHRLLAPETIPDKFPMKQMVTPEQSIFKAGDGTTIHGQLFVPKKMKKSDKLPAVIFMHGGPIRQMLLGWHMRGYYHNAYGLNQYLAAKGYVVLSVNYRAGIGYGRAFREAPNQGPRGSSEYQDIVAAARYLQSLSYVDSERIGLWGGSYGGLLTAMGLARDSELFAAGVDLHGVHDWALRGQRRNGGGWGLFGDELMEMAFESSPVADVAFWYSPVLFVHGDDDRNVDFIQTTDLVQRLRKEGNAHVEMLIFPDEVHGFLRQESWIQTYEATSDFFDRFLKNTN